MKAEDIKIAEKIIDKHAEFTDHYADQEYTKEGILKMMEEYTLYTEPVSEEENCPMCGSDDMFSFQQICYKCRSCDYRFTK